MVKNTDEPISKQDHPRRVRGAGGILLFFGLCFVAAGVTLVLLPRYVPELGWYVRKVTRLGITAGPLVIGGSVLFALALIARAQTKFFRLVGQRSDTDLMLEHLAEELADIRSDLRDTNTRIGQVREETVGLFEAVQARETVDRTDHESRDSIFRLAASLDKLGAFVDQRLAAQQTALQSILDDLRARIDDVGSSLEHARSSVADGAPAAPEASAYQPGRPSPSLGLLDRLGDNTQHGAFAEAAIKTSASDVPSGSLDYPPLAAGELTDGPLAPPAPLPHPVGYGGGDKDKMDELRVLLSDARVREALQSIQYGR